MSDTRIVSTIPVTLELPVPSNQFLFDLFVTALEGGIDYWANIVTYKPGNGDDLDGFYAMIYEDDDPTNVTRIDWFTIYTGLIRVARGDYNYGGKAPSSNYFQMKVVQALFDPDSADFDASDADNIVQVALFNDIVYG